MIFAAQRSLPARRQVFEILNEEGLNGRPTTGEYRTVLTAAKWHVDRAPRHTLSSGLVITAHTSNLRRHAATAVGLVGLAMLHRNSFHLLDTVG